MSSQEEPPDLPSGKPDDQAEAALPYRHQTNGIDKEVGQATSIQELESRTNRHLRVVLTYTYVVSLFAFLVVGILALFLVHDAELLGVWITQVSIIGLLIVRNLFPRKRDGTTGR